MSAAVTVRAPAKINLHLGVGAPRADGFHPLDTVYMAIGVHDDVTARLGEDAWNAENARSRAWMSSEFDQERLRAVRTEIIERGRGQR